MRKGFTLIELLLVIAILGATMMILMPNIGTLGGTQASLATQNAIQLMKYARNMAILNQLPIDVNFAQDGSISVSAQEVVSVATIAGDIDELSSQEDDKSNNAWDDDATTSPPVSKQSKQSEGVKGGSLDEIGITKFHPGVGYTFVEYLDDFEEEKKTANTGFRSQRKSQDELDEEDEDKDYDSDLSLSSRTESYTATIKSNGTCRPFIIRIHDADLPESGTEIRFDLLATGKVLEHE